MRAISSRPRWIAAAAGLATMVAVTSITSPADAAPADGDVGYAGNVAPSTSAMLTPEPALAQARTTGKKVVVSSATTPTDEVTANPDGTLTLTRSLVPTRKRVAGQWRDLDATLQRNADGTLSPSVATTAVVLSGGGDGPLAKLSEAGRAFALSAPMTLPAPTLSGDTATYAEVLPGVDLKVQVSELGGFSEVFVVRDATAAANPALKELVLESKTTGIELSSDSAGNVVGKDSTGRTVVSAPTPLMWDSTTATAAGAKAVESAAAAAPSSAAGPGSSAKVARLATAVSSTAIALTPGPLLTDAATRYPVYIDPTFTWSSTGDKPSGWATVAEQFPSTNYWKDSPAPDGTLQVGYSGSVKSRSLLTFAVPVSTLTGAKIDSAVIDLVNVHSYSCTDSGINMYAPSTDLTKNNATWNAWSSVSLGSAVQSKSFAHGYNSSCPARGEAFTVTSTIAADVNAGNTTRTFMLKAASETDTNGWKKFERSTATITIQYNHRPNTPTGLKTSPITSCTANPPTTIGDGPVTLNATVSDPNRNTLGVEYKLWKSSDTTQTALASSNMGVLTAGSNTTAVLNVDQRVLKTAAGNAITEFSWKVHTTDYPGAPTDTTHHSGWSTTCQFRYDPTRAGAPTVEVGPAQVGQPAAVTITKNSAGTAPSRYLLQLNGGAPITVTADASGNATAQIQPNRFTNILAVTSLSVGGNIGEAGNRIFNATPAAAAQPEDLTGDDIADLVAVGGGNDLPPGLWVATGANTGQVNAVGSNIGVYGTGTSGIRTPTAYTGAQVLTGPFTGNQLQDVLVYNPTGTNAGGGSIISGNGDGSALMPDSGTQYTITSDKLLEFSHDTGDFVTGSHPSQLANVNDIAGNGDGYPDLMGTSGNATTGYHLNYYLSASVSDFMVPTSLATPTPTGGTDWNNWTIASTLTSAGTDMFLWNRSTGSLYLWRGLDFSTGELVFTQHTLAASGWKTGDLSLQAADIDRDGDADLWTVGAGGTITAHLVGDTTTSPTVTAQTPQTMVTGNHAWLLNDAETGIVGAGAATDTVGTLHASGASAGTSTATAATSWDTGDLFVPDVELNGPDVTTKNGYLTTSGAPVATNTNFTLSLWAKPVTGGTVLSQDGTNTAAYKLWADPTDKSWRFAMSQTNATSPVWDTATARAGSAPWGAWSQITVTYNASNGTIILYVNGLNAASASHTVKWTPATTAAMRIGAHRSGTGTATAGYFGGKVAFVQTWNKMWKYPTANNHDHNRDGRNDVMTVGSDGKMWLYPNRGTGLATFGAPVQIGTGWSAYRWNISDWDLNGDADVIAIDTAGVLWWYPGNGYGAFLPRVQIGTGWAAYTHATGNGDANPHPDHYGIKTTTGELFWYPNGSGKVQIGTTGWGSYKLHPYDFNEDGNDDIIARDGAGSIWLYPHTGQAGTGMVGNRTQLASSWQNCRMGAVDVDNDSTSELLCIDGANNLWAYPSNGTNAFNTRYQIASGWTTTVATTIG